jgi:hypothetical protein
MVKRAGEGYYSDLASGEATPKVTLVTELTALRLDVLAKRVTVGEFDDTTEDMRAWFLGKEGERFLLEHFPGVSKARWIAVFSGGAVA